MGGLSGNEYQVKRSNCFNSNNNMSRHVDKTNETSEFGGGDRPLKGNNNNNANVSSFMMAGSDFVMPLDLSSASASNYLTGDLVKSVKVTPVNQVKSSMSSSSSLSSSVFSSASPLQGTAASTGRMLTTSPSKSVAMSSASASSSPANSCTNNNTTSSNNNHNKRNNSSPSMIGLGFCKPGLYSGIAPWIDPTFLSQTGESRFLDSRSVHASVDVHSTFFVICVYVWMCGYARIYLSVSLSLSLSHHKSSYF